MEGGHTVFFWGGGAGIKLTNVLCPSALCHDGSKEKKKKKAPETPSPRSSRLLNENTGYLRRCDSNLYKMKVY